MKKLLCFGLLLCLLCSTALAGAVYENVAAWYEAEGGALPEWICSVSSTDGTMEALTVIVKSEDDGARLRGMLEDDSGLTVIVEANAYSERELLEIQREIERDYLSDGVYSVGTGWTSVDGVVTGFGPSGKESRVVVGVDESRLEEFRALFADLYGDAVYVENSGRVVTESTSEEIGQPAPAVSLTVPLWIPVAAGAVLALGVLVFWLIKHLSK